MKFTLTSTFLPVLALVSSAAAQGSNIGYPTPGMVVHKGQTLTIQINRPVQMMGSTEVGIVLSFQYCQAPNPCPSPTNELGEVMFHGHYNPVRHENDKPPYQNFTVMIPNFEFWKPGPGRIVENRFHLIGAGPSAVLETNTVDVKLRN